MSGTSTSCAPRSSSVGASPSSCSPRPASRCRWSSARAGSVSAFPRRTTCASSPRSTTCRSITTMRRSGAPMSTSCGAPSVATLRRTTSRRVPVDVVFSSEEYGETLARWFGARHVCLDRGSRAASHLGDRHSPRSRHLLAGAPRLRARRARAPRRARRRRVHGNDHPRPRPLRCAARAGRRMGAHGVGARVRARVQRESPRRRAGARSGRASGGRRLDGGGLRRDRPRAESARGRRRRGGVVPCSSATRTRWRPPSGTSATSAPAARASSASPTRWRRAPCTCSPTTPTSPSRTTACATESTCAPG